MKTKFSNAFFLGLITSVLAFNISCAESEIDPMDMDMMMDEVEEEVDATVAGSYIGGWWSDPEGVNNYVNIPASAKIEPGATDSTWVGEFFFTRSFVSCCASGVNDGSISFKLSESSITEFVYDDVIPNCNGKFEGQGLIDQSGKIILEFTGSDCEGEHVGGRLELTKR